MDLVIPSEQMRDAGGRIVGATGLTPASTYLQRVIAAIWAAIETVDGVQDG